VITSLTSEAYRQNDCARYTWRTTVESWRFQTRLDQVAAQSHLCQAVHKLFYILTQIKDVNDVIDHSPADYLIQTQPVCDAAAAAVRRMKSTQYGIVSAS
jgi:hypothetical protein